MLSQNAKKGIYTILFIVGGLAVAYAMLAMLAKSGTSRFFLINDSDKPITYTVLHDDGDSANNKSLTGQVTIDPYGESEVSKYGGTYCLYLLDGEQATESLVLKYGVTQPQSMRANAPVYFVSRLTSPCEFDFNFPFDQS